MSTQHSILFVEDEQALAAVHVEAFEAQGFECEVAHDGLQALKLLKRRTFSVIVMDIIMPKMDGFGLLQRIKKDKEWSKIPVIVLSNLGQDADKQICMNTGACRYFIKTQTSQAELLQEIKRVIE